MGNEHKDIRKQMQELQESVKRHRQLIESAPYCIHEIDMQGRLISMNPAGLAMMDISHERDIKGMVYLDAVAAADKDRIERLLRAALNGDDSEFEFMASNDHVFASSFIPICNDDGDVVRLMGISHDITKRKRSEEELRDSDIRIRALLEGSPVCNKIVDLDSRLLYMSSAGVNRLKIADIEAFYGSTFPPDLYPKSMRSPVRERLERAKAGEISSIEGPVLDTEGNEVWYDTTFVPARNDDGQVEYVIVTSVDISERKQAEAAALKAQELLLDQQRHETERVAAELAKAREELLRKARLAAIGQVSASMAHELRNPLGAALNASYLLHRHIQPNDPKVTKTLAILDKELAQANQIITNLLAIARSRTPEKEAVDMGQLIASVWNKCDDNTTINCQIQLDPDPFLIEVDPTQIEQLIFNLATNAIQAMKGVGQLVIRTKRGEVFDTIQFQDSGPGLSPEIQDNLFDPLITTKARGTGLGLTICKQIVEAHGGTIEATDSDTGGALILVHLPHGPGTLT